MVANPILDGQHAKYIFQLHDLKKDLRVHAQMQIIAKTLDDKQIAVSKSFASIRNGQIQMKVTLQLGIIKNLVRNKHTLLRF